MTAPDGSDAPYDALLLVSFGGPEGPADVLPFLQNVTRGRGIPPERLAEVGQHYDRFGGVSPINAQNRALIAAIEKELADAGVDLPVYWGNRNWAPYLPDALQQMTDDGRRRALAFFTTAYSSYSGCRQYREDIERARAEVGAAAPAVEKVRHYFNHPGFVEPMVRNTLAALDELPPEGRDRAHLAFVAHSIPMAAASSSMYQSQLVETAGLVAERLPGVHPWQLVFSSRSGPPSQPWLEPDVVDHLDVLHTHGVRDVVLVPIGFVSDHIEVLFDLDTEARERADELGLRLARAATVGTDPQFVAMVGELVVERMGGAADRPFLGFRGPSHDVCPLTCCPGMLRR
ncbi:MAG: ferrochelatase [Actinomycetota bacterium]|nr:ferrochelatase [Actinomycetota bacterium]